MEKIISRIVAIAFAVIVVLFFAFNVVRFVQAPYSTEIVYRYTVQDSINAQGIMIRDETVIEDTVSGVPGYYYADGSRVSEGDKIIKLHPDMESVENEKKYNEIDEEIQALKSLQTYSGTNVLKANSLDRYINELISSLTLNTAYSVYGDISASQKNITNELNKKQIISGTVTDFTQRIDELETIKNSLTFAGEENVINAPQTGYFVSSTDGFESLINTSTVSTLTPSSLKQLIETPTTQNPDQAGKIITSNKWYFAVCVSSEDAEKFTTGAQVTLDFGISSFSEVDATVTNITPGQTEKEGVVVVFSGKAMSSQLASMRVKSADINFKSYSGLKVNEKAIRYTNNETWVYIVSGVQLKKIPVNVIYQGVGYVICSSVIDDTNEISLFDEVVIEGADLYDGKIVQ